jgi:hypothetical protein
MYRRFSLYPYFLLATILVVACESNGCFEKNGNEMIEEIPVSAFNELSVHGLFDLILVSDSVDYVEFIASEPVLDHLNARVEDGTMLLENSNSCFYQRNYKKVKAYIHYKNIKRINLYEACRLTNEYPIESSMDLRIQAEMAEVDITINAERFYFYNHTTTGGKYTFRGFADYASIAGYYTAQFNLGELVVHHLKLNNSSIGDMWVNPVERFDVEIHNRGNIYYTGAPEITIDSISGSGQLIHIQ